MSLQREGSTATTIAYNIPNANLLDWTDEQSVEWHEPPAVSVDERGIIQDCSESCESIFGYSRDDLVFQHISMLLPQFSGTAFDQEGRLTPLIFYLCHCGHSFQAQNRQGNVFHSELRIVRLQNCLRLFFRSL